jgi:hypothetical protein
MASFTPSTSVDLIVGSAGGTTFARNKGGNYLKVRKKSANPQSSWQMQFRNLFKSVSSLWATLSDSDRTGWNAATTYFPYVNRVGQSRFYSGFQLFMKMNTNLLIATGNTSNTAPINLSGCTIEEFSIYNLDTTHLDFGGTVNGDVANCKCLIFGNEVPSLGIGYLSPSKYKLFAICDASSLIGTGFNSDFHNRISPITTGRKYFFKVVFVRTDTGQVYPPYLVNGVAS